MIIGEDGKPVPQAFIDAADHLMTQALDAAYPNPRMDVSMRLGKCLALITENARTRMRDLPEESEGQNVYEYLRAVGGAVGLTLKGFGPAQGADVAAVVAYFMLDFLKTGNELEPVMTLRFLATFSEIQAVEESR